MKQKTNKESLKKLKFYDTNFKVMLISVLLSFISIFLLGSIGEIISVIFMIVAIIPYLIIKWGMFYHQFKTQSWGWLLPSIALTIFGFGLGFIAITVFYFKVMREEFKNGKGVYS